MSENKVIAFVSSNAWSVYNFRVDVIRHFIKNGYKVLVIAPDDGNSELLIAEGCMYENVDFNNKSENHISDLSLYRQLKVLYEKHKPDFIFHYVIKPNIYGSLAARKLKIPSVSVITGLGYPFAKKNWLYLIVKSLYKRALKKVTEVWFLNNEDAKVFTSNHIVPIEKIKVMPGEGVNTEHFTPDFETPLTKNGRFVFLM
ncbi:MAG TPA: glycosyltransferase, partial [Chitinophagaceae bacterium]|nr:glycosyltransferase [Chitinophagaceae bacterium]